MSRAAERRALREVRQAAEAEPIWASMTLKGLGVEQVPNSQKWFAFQCCTDGTVKVLTPLYGGQLKGESKPAATGRLKVALMRILGRLDI